MYRGKTDGGSDPKLVAENIAYPTDIFLDDEDEEIIYYISKNDALYRYNDDEKENLLIRNNYGAATSFYQFR